MKKLLFILLLCSSAFGQFQQKPMLGEQIDWSNPLSKGLVYVGLFNEGSGNKVFDLSGNGNEGTRYGTGTIWVPGKFGSAQEFNGSDDRVEIPDNSRLDFGANQDFTLIVEFKIRSLAAGNSKYLQGKYVATDQPKYYQRLTVSADGRAFSHIHNGTTGVTTFTSSVIDDGKWHCLVSVFDRDRDLTNYLDGILDGTPQDISAYSGDDLNNNGYWGIGNVEIAQALEYFDGLIDHVIIYNRALSASEIALLYREPFCMFEKDDIALIASVTAPPAPGGQFIMINMAMIPLIAIPLVLITSFCLMMGRKNA